MKKVLCYKTKFKNLKWILLFTGMVLINGIGCTKKKPLKYEISQDSYIKKSLFSFKKYRLVVGIERADENLSQALVGLPHNLGQVKVKISENLFKVLSIKDSPFIQTNYHSNTPLSPKAIAVFPIKDHFDIVRLKNDFGEVTHKIVEDRQKPWNQRAYMRVRWDAETSKNFLFLFKIHQLQMVSSELIEQPSFSKDGQFSVLIRYYLKPKNEMKSYYADLRVYLMPVKEYKKNFPTRLLTKEDLRKFGVFVKKDYYQKDYEFTGQLKMYPLKFNVCESSRKDTCSHNKIIWYLNKNFPNHLIPLAQQAVQSWNKAFQTQLQRKDNVVVLNLRERKNALDPRYNVIAFHPYSPKSSPLGVASIISDEETGMTISAKANIYGATIRRSLRILDYYLNQIKTNSFSFPPLSLKPQKDPIPQSCTAQEEKELLKKVKNQIRDIITPVKKVSSQTQIKTNLLKKSTNFFMQELLKDFSVSSSNSKLLSLLSQNIFMENKEKKKFFQSPYQTYSVYDKSPLDISLLNSSINLYLKQKKTINFIKERAFKNIFMNTILHEMGHGFGLRHNFKASLDEKNYLSGWKKSENKNYLSKFKYATSSVMDYIDSFDIITQSHYELGPYDLAAIKFIYDMSISPKDSIFNRNFKFCTDEDLYQIPKDFECQKFDIGNNFNQVTLQRISEFEKLYPLTHLKLNREFFQNTPEKIYSFVIEHFMIPLRSNMDLFHQKLSAQNHQDSSNNLCSTPFIQKSIQKGEATCNPQENLSFLLGTQFLVKEMLLDEKGNFLKDPSEYEAGGFADLLYANYLSEQFFLNVLSTPDVKTKNISGHTVSLPVGIGKYLSSQLTRLPWENGFEHIGFNIDKLAALQALASERLDLTTKDNSFTKRIVYSPYYYSLNFLFIRSIFSSLIQDNQWTFQLGNDTYITSIPQTLKAYALVESFSTFSLRSHPVLDMSLNLKVCKNSQRKDCIPTGANNLSAKTLKIPMNYGYLLVPENSFQTSISFQLAQKIENFERAKNELTKLKTQPKALNFIDQKIKERQKKIYELFTKPPFSLKLNFKNVENDLSSPHLTAALNNYIQQCPLSKNSLAINDYFQHIQLIQNLQTIKKAIQEDENKFLTYLDQNINGLDQNIQDIKETLKMILLYNLWTNETNF
ncbi:MAG: hypothetical protein D6797_02240 [Bdellovibrio sp.]|nr:MAG: hypothetical protein D6797_02240 [Bdellovibrio sp.]